jgi:REP element-mobilizing transposase RayT
MQFPPVLLDEHARQTVLQTIQAHCEIRKWNLHAANVRSNHVHVVLSAGELTPEEVLKQLKAWTTRRLRESGYVPTGVPVWTEDGSKKYLWKPEDIAGAVEYTMERQGPEFH